MTAPQVVNYTGPAVVVVSCVTVDPPYRPHPHNLVGKDGCRKGVCTVNISNDNMECVFSNLGEIFICPLKSLKYKTSPIATPCKTMAFYI